MVAMVVVCVVCVVMMAMAGCAKAPDNSEWIIITPGTNYVRNAKGQPEVSGNTVTYTDLMTGERVTISGRFEIRPSPR